MTRVELCATYGGFRIMYTDDKGVSHTAGEDLFWNESEATDVAATIHRFRPGYAIEIQHQNPETGTWRRW